MFFHRRITDNFQEEVILLRKYGQIVVVYNDIAKEIRRYLQVASEHDAGDQTFWEAFWENDTGLFSLLSDETTVSFTAVFPDRIEMDIKLCGSDASAPWTEAVLFQNGSEICCSEPAEDFFGEWELEYNGVIYGVTVVSVPEMLNADDIIKGGTYVAVTDDGRFYDAVFDEQQKRLVHSIPQTERIKGFIPVDSLPVVNSGNLEIGGLYRVLGTWGLLEQVQYLSNEEMKRLDLYCPVRVTISIKGGQETTSFGLNRE